jgi:predicted DNA-binding transcriptional regulator YafY
MNRFGIKEAAATRDISLYKEHAPNNLEYNESLKIYKRAKDFEPLFEYTSNQVLTALTKGFGEDLVGVHTPLITCETPAQLNNPPLPVLSVLSRAIHQKKVVNICYRSVHSGKSKREIVPFALIFNGLRWHIRAYDRKRAKFSDFVITRISEPSISGSLIQEKETRDADIQWNRIIEMEIAAHPRLKHPETIEEDYNMEKGVLHLNVRAALAGYVLRIWNIDCSENHFLDGDEIHLWLRNVAALYGVENLFMAPGYNCPVIG